MSVTVVLDTSAILAYTNSSIAVGELLSIVADDDDTAVIPAACLAEAHRRLEPSGSALLGVLAGAPCVAVTPLTPEQAPDVGRAALQAGGIDLGHVVVEALAHRAQVATQDVVTVSSLLPDGWPVLEM